MSLLFSQPVRVQTAFSTGSNDPEAAFLGSDLWNSLKIDSNDLFISISSLQQHSLPSLSCLARRGEAVSTAILPNE